MQNDDDGTHYAYGATDLAQDAQGLAQKVCAQYRPRSQR
jgi:hypothetical protein